MKSFYNGKEVSLPLNGMLEVHEGQDYVHIYGDGYDDSAHPMAIVPNKKIGEQFVHAVNSYAKLKRGNEALKKIMNYIEGYNDPSKEGMELLVRYIYSMAKESAQAEGDK